MKRIKISPRSEWQKKVEEVGLIYHTPEGKTYWDESVYYEFTSPEIDLIESATNELQEMCLNAGQQIIDKNRFDELHIPRIVVPLIQRAWDEEPPAIYGRFDLAFDGTNLKLLEYNADTPTALLEASVVQWFWLQELFPTEDQFNSIHEKLLAKWQELKSYLKGDVLYLTSVDDFEDIMTVTYMQDLAEQAGIKTLSLLIDQIGWHPERKCFTDLDEHEIVSIFKLYPWEWLVHEKFGPDLIEVHDKMQWIEPIWKMLWSNKGILPILWELYPNHPYLLEAYFGEPRQMKEYAKKPLLSREGANIEVHTVNGTPLATGGDYGEEGYIFQALAPIPNIEGNYPVLGSWVIDGVSAGMGIRESVQLVTDNLSRFVPHLFRH
ncbi:glutathionylspermidine synthase family protein [Candidatus Acetothermia bacterium]|nr:glutathionylspermidine synthase family protein [Candidatus Acetothermia bacterium]MBI3461160.1 glutathionylspermidine synthase family protein [Candidatus Acetothermia bacterium]